jgi:hypothetical protein
MKLTPDTILILKNYASINQSLLFRKGNILATISGQKNTLASAIVKEKFPKEFAIYDLNEFLSVLSLFVDPSIDIKDNYLAISVDTSRHSVKYFFADSSMIVTPPEDKSKMEKAIKGAEIEFKLTEDDFMALLKASSVLGSPEVAVSSDGKEILLVALDTKNSTSNNYAITLGEGNGTKFTMVFKTENLKMLKGSYDVKISKEGISYFKNTDIKLEYYISLEQSSVYGE